MTAASPIAPTAIKPRRSGLGIGGGDLGFELPTYDFLGDIVSTKVDEIVEKIKGALSEITAVISGFLLAIGTILVVTGANVQDQLRQPPSVQYREEHQHL